MILRTLVGDCWKLLWTRWEHVWDTVETHLKHHGTFRNPLDTCSNTFATLVGQVWDNWEHFGHTLENC